MTILGCTRISENVKTFDNGDAFLRTVYDTHVLMMLIEWAETLRKRQSNYDAASEICTLDQLCTWVQRNDWSILLDTVVDKMFPVTKVHFLRDPKSHGQPSDLGVVPLEERRGVSSQTAQSRKLRKKYELFERRKRGDQFRDIVYENAVLFMQQCTVYLDLADSIKAGDSGRTLFNLDLQLCMFHAG